MLMVRAKMKVGVRVNVQVWVRGEAGVVKVRATVNVWVRVRVKLW